MYCIAIQYYHVFTQTFSFYSRKLLSDLSSAFVLPILLTIRPKISGFHLEQCFVVTCWERADLLALVCGVFCEFVTFPLVSWVRCGT